MRSARRPLDPVTYAEAARILGVTPFHDPSPRGRWPAEDFPPATQAPHAVPCRRRGTGHQDDHRYRLHISDSASYWVTNERAAAILGVNRARLNQLAAKDFIPFEVHADGTRLTAGSSWRLWRTPGGKVGLGFTSAAPTRADAVSRLLC